MFTLVANQRKRREIDPILSTLRDCETRLATGRHAQADERRARVHDLLSFLSLVDGLAQRFFESRRGLREAVDLLAGESD
jgi:hypothetical protein